MKIKKMFKAINFFKLFQSSFFLTTLFLLFFAILSLEAQDSQSRLSETREKLETAVSAGQADVSDMAELGMTYIQLEEYELARQILMSAHQKDIKNQQVLEALGRLELANGNYEAADKWFNSVDDRLSLLEQNHKLKVNFLINCSIEFYHDDNFEKAEDLLKEALSLDPYHPLALSMLIQLGKEQGYNSSLVELYQRLLLIEPENAQAYAELGMLLDEQGHSAEAEKAFKNAEMFSTEEPYPYFYLAAADRERKILKNQNSSSLEVSRLHLAIGKSFRKISLIQLQAANTIQQKQGELSSKELSQLERLSGLFIRPKQILKESIILLKECYPNNADYEEDLRRLIEWYPHSLELCCSLGNLLDEQQRFDEAYEYWRDILENLPTAAEAHIGMARSLEALGRLHQAEVAYQRARDLTPENREIYLALNRLYLSNGQEEILLQWYAELYEREQTNIILLNAWADLEEVMGLLENATIHRLRVKKLEEYN